MKKQKKLQKKKKFVFQCGKNKLNTKKSNQIIYTNLKAIITGNGFAQKNGRFVKNEDLQILEGPLHILCKNNQIVEITSKIPKKIRKVDCSGLVASPAFIDSHTHALFGGARWNEYFDRWSGKSYIEINKAGGGIRKTFRDTQECKEKVLISSLDKRLKLMHKEGVRVVEIKSGYGSSADEELRILKTLKKYSSKAPVEIKKTFLGLHAIPSDTDEKTWTTQMINLLPQISKEKLADFVDAFPEVGFFSIQETERFFKAAQKLGINARIHADEITHMGAAELGVKMSALSVDHLQKISDQALKSLKNSQTVATVLPATSFFMGLEYAPARKIIDHGARLALATDYNPGTAPDSSILFTAKLAASQMKLSPAEIFCGLTYNAAAALGYDSKWGMISPHYSSEFLLWDCETNFFVEEILLSGKYPIKN
jgi:imidazolonepropionase